MQLDLLSELKNTTLKHTLENRIKKNMKGVLNSKLKEIQNLLMEKNFDLIKILGAGGGGYFLAKYKPGTVYGYTYVCQFHEK